MPSEKGKIFLRFMVLAMVYGLKHISKQILGVDLTTDLYKEWQKAAAEVRQRQAEVSYEERIARLEAAASLSSQEARVIAGETLVEVQQQGQVVTPERANMVADLASTVPALIHERTQATLRQARRRGTAVHTALPVGDDVDEATRDAFYQSLFPLRLPRFRADDAIPHRFPAWYFVQLLGIGGFGEVWEVRHPHLPDHFAVKFCQNELSAKILKREAQALVTLCHKLPLHAHIARLLELQLEQEPYWLAFELVTGGTLEALLRTGPLSWDESLKIFRPLVAAMAAVHQVGIVHRDLKPANILLTTDNVPKIADFGIGKVLADSDTEQQPTRTKFTSLGYGSVGYMSEEQQAGKVAHPADDTFALGVLLWQMLSGSLEPPPRYLRRLVNKLTIPQSIRELIVNCIDEPREERPPNAGTLLAVLESLRQESLSMRQELTPKPLLSPPVAGTIFVDKLKDGSEGPKMVWLPTGKFMMGSNEEDEEKPIHEVVIAYVLAVGQYPVTVGQFKKFVHATNYRTEAEKGAGAYVFDGSRWNKKADASWKNPYFSQTDNHPVVCVSWQDAQAYCRWLSEQTGRLYRLPSEAEWEYACRAGTITRYSFGDNDQDLAQYAWFDDNSSNKTHSVGKKSPNAWKLYDMHGNVWEWCQDVWHDNYKKAPMDGSAWVSGGEQEYHLLRGGSWYSLGYYCHAAYRKWDDGQHLNCGFRIGVASAGEKLGQKVFGPAVQSPELSAPQSPPSIALESPKKDCEQPQKLSVPGAGTIFSDQLKDGSEGPKMVWLPPGKFMMGSNEEDEENPIHEVAIAYVLAIGQYPVTVGQFKQFVHATNYRTQAEKGAGAYVYGGEGWEQKTDASWKNPYFSQTDNHPVVCVSWQDAQAYCRWLSKQTGRLYRLPSEAEWEYACRAGTITRYSCGDNNQDLAQYAWFRYNSGNKTHSVGEKKPNAWELYDMHGNVWEWCQDVWHGNYQGAPTDGSAWVSDGDQDWHVLRGGSWHDGSHECRGAFRNWLDYLVSAYGFRVVIASAGEKLGQKVFGPAVLSAPQSPPPIALESPKKDREQQKLSIPRPAAPKSLSSPPVARTIFSDQLKDGGEGPKMVWLPPGKFMMGSNEEDEENPIHEVAIAYVLAIGQYPVTVGQFKQFVHATNYRTEAEKDGGAWVSDGSNWNKETDASWKEPYFSQTDNCPVVCVSWQDAQAYCRWLSKQTGRLYRLPSEAEWEYACRAGTITRYSCGDNDQDLAQYAWFLDNSDKKTHSVGEKRPNAWELYDMHGNVWEWCQDVWHDSYKKAPTDGSAWVSGGEQNWHVLRGGSWNSYGRDCRAALRHGNDERSGYYGFRVIVASAGEKLGRKVFGPAVQSPELSAPQSPPSITLESPKKDREQQKLSIPRPAAPKSLSLPPVAGMIFGDKLKDGSEGPKMVWLPPGKFMMGSNDYNSEKPIHEVTIAYALAVGQYPITVGQFKKFVHATNYRTEAENGDGAYVYGGEGWEQKTDASWKNPYFSQTDNCPVVCVSWQDAQAYCHWLSKQTGRPYRLPSEAEWEYACRAGTTTHYFFGDNDQDLAQYAWFDKNSDNKTRPVGKKKPNGWKLYDMHGNVWEWCQDVWHDNYEEASMDGSAWVSGGEQNQYVLRGGSWRDYSQYCRAANRLWDDLRYSNDGFRVVVASAGEKLGRKVFGPLVQSPELSAPPPSIALESPKKDREQPQKLSTPGAGTIFSDKLKDGSEGPKMVWLPTGKFMMGDNNGDSNEKPAHQVTIAYTLALGQYPITVGQFKQFVYATNYRTEAEKGDGAYVWEGSRWNKKADASWKNPYSLQTDNCPVVCVSWQDAQAYCHWLSEQTGCPYRLPSEAEWEYACRAGTTTRYFFGDNDQDLAQYAWFDDNSSNKTHPVGEKKPNAWKLYDMHGNVWEWCQDVWHDNYKKSPMDGSAWVSDGKQNWHVLRGGSWHDGSHFCRAANRHWLGVRGNGLGFRVCVPPAGEKLGQKVFGPSVQSPELSAPQSPPSVALESPKKDREQAQKLSTPGAGTIFGDKLKDGGEGPKMVWLPPGKFMMGSNEGDEEKPIHEVVIAYALAIGQYPVTVGQFKQFVHAMNYQTEAEKDGGAYIWWDNSWNRKADASWKNPYFSQTDNHPVVCVSWQDAQAYCHWLSEQTGRFYRLPSEAEWEYACRAGTITRYSCGDNDQDLAQYAWFRDNSGNKTHSVGEKKPNAWELYDMHGNVWEWCQDVWHDNYHGAPTNGSVWVSGGEQECPILRGGSWGSNAHRCRAANRKPNDDQNALIGFRVVMLR